MSSNPPVLCYVDGPWAYFTTQELSEQWGDDWNDAPYEHNAGQPYEYSEHDRKNGVEPWQITKVAFDGDLNQPCTGCVDSDISVQDINAGKVAWLYTSKWNSKQVAIHAGATLAEFCELVREAGGTVYLPVPEIIHRGEK